MVRIGVADVERDIVDRLAAQRVQHRGPVGQTWARPLGGQREAPRLRLLWTVWVITHKHGRIVRRPGFGDATRLIKT